MKSQLRRRLLKAASKLGLHYFSLATVVAYGGERVKIPKPTLEDFLESSHQDDSYKWSNFLVK